MPKIRFTISGLMGLIVVVAIGFAGIREGTETWASVTFAVTAPSCSWPSPASFTPGVRLGQPGPGCPVRLGLPAFHLLVAGRATGRAAVANAVAAQLGARPDPCQAPVHTQPQLPPAARPSPSPCQASPGPRSSSPERLTGWATSGIIVRSRIACWRWHSGRSARFWSRHVYSFQLRRCSSESPARESSTNANAAEPDATSTGHLD